MDLLISFECHLSSLVHENGFVEMIFCFIGSIDQPSGFQKRVFSLFLLNPSTTVDQEIMQFVSS